MPTTYKEGSESSPVWATITPSDSANITYKTQEYVTRAIYVGGAGNIAAVSVDDSVVVFTGVPAGTVLQVEAKRVNSTSTTATSLVAMF